ncbi:MAG: hypothetical protein WCI56_12460 [Hyphomicrobiales bacterium]
MTHAHHHHHPGHVHPPAAVAASILRLSVWRRLTVAVFAIALIWGAVFWAIV